MLFSSWASLAAGDWGRRPEMFEHLRFCFNEFPLWCNDLIRFCCTMVLLMTTGQSSAFTTNQVFTSLLQFFEPPRVFPGSKTYNNRRNSYLIRTRMSSITEWTEPKYPFPFRVRCWVVFIVCPPLTDFLKNLAKTISRKLRFYVNTYVTTLRNAPLSVFKLLLLITEKRNQNSK